MSNVPNPPPEPEPSAEQLAAFWAGHPIVDLAERHLRLYGEHIAREPLTRLQAERLLPMWEHYREMSPREIAATLARFGQPGENTPNDLEDPAIAHSQRFRQVSTRYPRRVAEAYSGDLAHAMSHSDEQVAATVAQWERDNGEEVRDWHAIGHAEGQGE